MRFFLSKRNIQNHHHTEAKCKKHRADIGVLSGGHFRNQLLDHDVEHCPGGKTEEIRQRRNDAPGGEDRQHRSDRLDDPGKDTAQKGASLPIPSARSGMEMIAPSGKF